MLAMIAITMAHTSNRQPGIYQVSIFPCAQSRINCHSFD